ncbi:hypothetical protein QJS10_CPA05g00114 [Acorus calamus]|uniref:tRNA:m(4)X modification enzyme TRM13 n=1 Tax=Acorus calamus TaxID=4465 RepID=A0AAV9EQ79_ACOCL|nr:hypothetical protein QJS10_CPA05g00114 [Acorus calamus]
MEVNRCQFWLPNKRRFCANAPLNHSMFCGNHNPTTEQLRIPCPIDPSHSILKENMDTHIKRCPFEKQNQELKTQPFYKKGVNGGGRDDPESLMKKTCIITSDMKRNMIYKLGVHEYLELVGKIESIHKSLCSFIKDSYVMPEACEGWLASQIDRKLPIQEKHARQQASILGNMESLGILQRPAAAMHPDFRAVDSSGGQKTCPPAVIEFGAGRGYLTQMLADYYGIRKVVLVERKSYRLKADRSLRQKESLSLERLRIDIEDLNLNAVESLKGCPCLAIGKHLCGPATDLTLRCCLPGKNNEEADHLCPSFSLQGLAIATCCHHLCQWKHYLNKNFLSEYGLTKEDFHAMTWFTSWAVDGDHSSAVSDAAHQETNPRTILDKEPLKAIAIAGTVEEIIKKMEVVDRATLGFMCKDIIDMGRLMWMKEHNLGAQLVKYVPSSISPENHLLIAKSRS